jgi:hypothetical protein
VEKKEFVCEMLKMMKWKEMKMERNGVKRIR